MGDLFNHPGLPGVISHRGFASNNWPGSLRSVVTETRIVDYDRLQRPIEEAAEKHSSRGMRQYIEKKSRF
jgi:hypothetical protein